MFERPHHRRIASVLETLNAPLLRQRECLFGGGTAIALRYGEYRESVDIDLLVSRIEHYRELRNRLTSAEGLSAIIAPGALLPEQIDALRADQYGIRTALRIEGQRIKLEIVHEARIELQTPGPGDVVCGVATLTPLDMAASKLLANSDRWLDDGVWSRDLIDLAMMRPSPALLREAVAKAERAYGPAILRDLARAIDRVRERQGWLDRCTQTMSMTTPPALVWERIRALRTVLPAAPAPEKRPRPGRP